MMTRMIVLLLLLILIIISLEKGGNTMARAKSEPNLNIDIPLIDVNAPLRTETATFALG
jgi:hypothetical protein